MNMDRIARDTIAAHPYPSADPLDRLRHTVSVFADSPADATVIIATSGIYPPEVSIDQRHRHTGLTHGDLRALLEQLGG